ncbi:type VI secretion system tip protein VgrG [Denitromonas halophila]|uniref:Type VI secretion system tip protein VgrG n=2 Tax=Denitromonas halophila TaxID=1629404 RepID=A0A557R1U8_9RHOO|nr:type VI secretion system tip protein VgrG [Denitromonas halophila]
MRLTTPAGNDVLLAETATIHEAIGPLSEHSGLRIALTAVSEDAHLALDALLGQPARLDLQTALSRVEARPFHGHITAISRLGANGGFSRYRLIIEPWLAFLAHRQDSFIFQQRSVIEIVDAVFSRWVGQGCLNPAWRWDLADPARYPKRGTTTQYQESDLAFVRRLLAEEGLFCWFEHAVDDTSAFGQHTLVISDHNAAFTDNPQPVFRFTQPGATMRDDSVDRWHGIRRLDTAVLAAGSWDYRSLDPRDQHDESRIDNGHSPRLAATDDPGQYAWQDRAHGERMLRAQREAIDARAKQFLGQGTVRTAAPASAFTLVEHAEHEFDPPESRHFVITDIIHCARNNLDEHIPGGASATTDSVLSGTDGGLKPALQKAAAAPQGHKSVGPDSSGRTASEHSTPPVELYRNHFRAIRSHIPWRPLMADGHGRHIHPRPTVYGALTAVVVGPGTPTHTDRDGRILVQFPWQRGSHSANRFDSAEHDNAPASDALGAWVRVMSPAAGANWGGHWTPRPGQEVLVAFDHGNIDRPVIIGALYNGQGNDDAPGNRLGAATMAASANAPAFFAGRAAEPHRHNASLSGLKTQQLSASRHGQGGANHLIFDDTPGEPRISLGSTEYASTLNLGHLKQQHDNARLKDRGHGAELTTHAAVAVRAGSGLLISADARPGASGTHLDSREALSQHEDGKSLTIALADVAAKQNAALAGDAAADQLPVSEGLSRGIDTLGATATRGSSANGGLKPALQPAATAPGASAHTVAQGHPSVGPDSSGQSRTGHASFKTVAGGEGTVPAWSAPRLQYSAPAGIAQLTPASAILVAGKTLSLAGQDINLVAQGNHSLAVKDGIALFTVGKAGGNKPNTETGIALHAASGKVSVQAQSGQLRAAANKTVTLASTGANLKASAKTHLLATAGGAYLKLEGGNISLHAPGPVKLKASMKNLTGPKSSSVGGSLPKAGDLRVCAAVAAQAGASGATAI